MTEPTPTPPTPTHATKAVFAGIIACLGALATAFADNGITPLEAITTALATVTAVGAVYGVTNTPKEN